VYRKSSSPDNVSVPTAVSAPRGRMGEAQWLLQPSFSCVRSGSGTKGFAGGTTKLVLVGVMVHRWCFGKPKLNLTRNTAEWHSNRVWPQRNGTAECNDDIDTVDRYFSGGLEPKWDTKSPMSLKTAAARPLGSKRYMYSGIGTPSII
jgi:hypothetical protein